MSRPNFVFIVSDSLRADCLSYAGHPDVQTPNLDRASRRGITFSNHHAQAPVCGPSRNSFWTGRYPHSNGSFKNLASFGSHQQTFVQLLGNAGYDCVSFGSNHLQPEPGGFRTLVSSRNKHPESSYRKYLADLGIADDPARIDPATVNRSSPPFGLLSDDSMDLLADTYSTTRAIEYLAAVPESPFFLYIGLHLPHPPYVADRKHFEKYDLDGIQIADYQNPEIALHPKLQKLYVSAGYGSLEEQDVRMITALYLAMVTYVDEQVGRIMAALEEAGLDDNTHIVFTSDHGDFCGEMGMYVKTDLPIRSLTHVPLLWIAPEKAAGHSESFTENIDLAPTFLQAAGVELPYTLEGTNLFDCDRDWAMAESCDGHYSNETQRDEKTTCYTAYVDREWHYIHATDAAHCALYQLTQDPHCHRNVISDNTEVADQLRTRILDRLVAGTTAHQDNSLASWEEYHGGTGVALNVWD